MSEKRENDLGRRLRYHRRLHGKKTAVSPVVATLILILVAVAAAAALYLWLVAWQGGVTHGIGSPGAQYTVTIGGSTSVYPFASAAATQFEQNNSDVVISVNQGGSGAGMAAVCSGQVDIGEASTFYGSGAQPAATPATIESSYGCPSTVAVEVIAYDGVDPIVSTSNTHGLNSINWDTLQAIYVDASTTAPTSGSNIFQVGSLSLDGDTTTIAQPAQGTGFVWDQIPAFAAADLGNTYATVAFTDTGYSATAGGALGAAEAACGAPYGADLCDATAQATSCGFSICAGGSGPGAASGDYQAPIGVNVRSDVSGTTQSFIARLLAVSPTSVSPANPLNLGFTGCSGDNQFDGCGLAYPSGDSHAGDPAMITAVGGSKDAIGYSSDGLAQSGDSGVTPVNFQGFGQTVVVTIVGESTALKAIANGIADHETQSSSLANSQAYVGWRPFLNVETAPPTGEVLRYLQWIMDPANNEAVAAATDEISVYASGLAGVVPVTPIP